MGTEMIMVDEVPFPPQITVSKLLTLLGHGITDIEIHFLQIKFTAIGVYLEPEIVGHLQQWKGKKGNELVEDDLFFEALVSAPGEKLLRVVVIKEIKGSQYGVQLESAVRDRLAAIDKYEEEEEEALEKVVEFFQSKYFKKNSIITFHFPAASRTLEIGFTAEGKDEVKFKVENENIVEMIQKWYLGGNRAVSSTTVASLASGLEALLSTHGGSEIVMVDEVPFPSQVTVSKPLTLLGHGITDIEIHFLQIKFTAIGVYLEPETVGHLQQWKGKKGNELVDDDLFFEALISAPVEKFLRVVVIKEIKGAQYGVQLESAVRDRLAAIDKYEEEEEEALEKVVEFFQSKYFKKNSIITFLFPATSHTAEIGFTTEGKEEVKLKVENENVVEMIKKWYLGGSRAVSPTTVSSLASGLGALLSK